MAPTHKEEPDPENSFNNFDNASTAGIMTPQGQVRNRCKRWTALLCSTIGVVCILVSYVICGAIVFSNLEGNNSYNKAGNNNTHRSLNTKINELIRPWF